MSIPRIIHQFWEGDMAAVSDWMRSVREKHEGWEYRLWNTGNIEGLKPSAFGRDFHKLASWAEVSNGIRLAVLQEFGGVYLDADVECLKPLTPLLEASAFAAYQDDKNICNAVMGAEPDHPWINWQLERILEHNVETWGCSVATDAPREGLTIYPNHYFYPFLWSDEVREPDPESYAVHHWLMSWCPKC